MTFYNLISFTGIFIITAFAWLLSENKKIINWRLLFWGIIIQCLFALFIFIFPFGIKIFIVLNDLVIKLMVLASEGAKFVFGRLAFSPGEQTPGGEPSLGFMLAFQAFPTIIFFSAFMSLLYYYNILPRIIKGFSFLFTKLMKVSGVESLAAASNIFVGVESALVIKPHLAEMTRSELCTLLTAGMATVSSNVLALYIFSLRMQFPMIAGHLISASILSAPAALIMSKMIIPETDKPKTLGVHVQPYYEKENSPFESVIKGANSGVQLIIGITALLIAVLGLTAIINYILVFSGAKINLIFHINIDWSLKGLLGYIFYPFMAVTGVAFKDIGIAARIVGERAVLTEVTAYQDLAAGISGHLIHDPRSVIITYALCGFAHLASLSIFIGGIAALIPERIKVLAEIGFRSLIAATLSCLMTACIAGTFITSNSILFSR